MSTLQVGDSEPYAELAGRPLPEGLSLVFVPSLAALLLRAQDLNGAALTENQVLRIRDGSTAVVVPRDVARSMEEQRGYANIDATAAWQGWLQLRDAKA